MPVNIGPKHSRRRRVQRHGLPNAPARAVQDSSNGALPDAPNPPQTAIAAPTDHDAGGRFTKGNKSSLRHGLHVVNDPSNLAETLARNFFAQALTDDGGEHEPSTRRKSLLEYRSRLHAQILMIGNALEHHGIFDRRGKLRAVWLGKLESLINTALSADRLLGLDRRARRTGALDGTAIEFVDSQRTTDDTPGS
jgi:hypothetical protein